MATTCFTYPPCYYRPRLVVNGCGWIISFCFVFLNGHSYHILSTADYQLGILVMSCPRQSMSLIKTCNNYVGWRVKLTWVVFVHLCAHVRDLQQRPAYQPSGESDKENKRLEAPQSPSSSDMSLSEQPAPPLSR